MGVFIWIFFAIGIVAVITLTLPTIVEVVIYLCSIFANFGVNKENKIEVKKELLNKKKELKLAKIGVKAEEEKAKETITTLEQKEEVKQPIETVAEVATVGVEHIEQ